MTATERAVDTLRGSRLATYGVAVAAPLLVSVLKVCFEWLGRDAPVALYMVAVMVAAWLGGRGPGLVATAVSSLATSYFFLAPYGSVRIASGDDTARLLITAGEGIAISVLAGQLVRSREAARRALAESSSANEALRRATEQLHHASRMSAVGQLTGGVAHDVNNMVTVVLTCTELLERRFSEDAGARAHTAEIRAAAERASGLAKQLLAFARKGPTLRGPFDVNELVERSAWLIRRAAGPAVDVGIAPRATDSRVLGDGRLFEQVLVNLTINARDAMPSGGHLDVETSNLTGDADGERLLEVSVKDTGVGMDEATRQRALEPFFSTKPAGEGTGLGLSVAVGIVEGMGGELAIESGPGRGTTVRIRLPVVAAAVT